MTAGRVTLVATLALASCASPPLIGETPPAVPSEQRVLEASSAATWKAERCKARKPMPYLKLTPTVIKPDRVQPGTTVAYEMTTILCTRKDADLSGQLETAVMFEDKPMLKDADGTFLLHPGRWSLIRHLSIPKDASRGEYQIESRFSGLNQVFLSVGKFSVTD